MCSSWTSQDPPHLQLLHHRGCQLFALRALRDLAPQPRVCERLLGRGAALWVPVEGSSTRKQMDARVEDKIRGTTKGNLGPQPRVCKRLLGKRAALGVSA